MFIRHPSKMKLQGGRSLDLGLDEKDDINFCEGELPCDQ